MFKSLLRTLPSLSGNVKLVCDVSDVKYIDNNNEYIDCYVNNASLEPISKNVYKQPININLFKSRYDYDLAQFYTLYNDIFYKSCYSYSKVDAKKIDKSHDANERDKDFEFGCSRISYSDNNKQFSFFAPIYIDNVFDIPNAFIIEANIRYGEYIIKKKLRINIASNVDLTDSKTNIIYKSKNLLFNYIYNYVFNIDDKVIYMDYVDANNSNNNNVYYYGVDLKRGGFTRTQDITVNKIFSDQQTINNFDNIICSGFKNTNICMKQILPLCFNFNIDELFNGYDASKIYLSDITFSGYYINKNNKVEDIYDFDIDYSKFNLNILDINGKTGDMIAIPGLVDNMMDYSFPSLHEKYFYKYQFMNKISPNTTRWILAASNGNADENYNYIINNNLVFSINQDSQYKYRYFPVDVNGGNNVGCCNKISLDTENVVNDYNYIYNNNNIYFTQRNRTILYNLLLPIENKISGNINTLQSEVYNTINDLFSTLYKKDKISNCYDFFNVIYHDNKIYNKLNENSDVIKREINYIDYINPSNGYNLLQSTSNDNISIFDKNGVNYNTLWKTPINNYVYYNDILYNLNNLYINNDVVKLQDRYNKFLEGDTDITNSLFEIAKQNKNAHFIDDTNYNNYLALQKITKFGVFAIPFFNVINNKQIKKLYKVNNLFTLVNNPSSLKYDDIIVSSNILNKEHIDNKFINFYNAKNTIESVNLNTTIDVNNSLYIDDLTSDSSNNKWKEIFLAEGHLRATPHTYTKQVIINGETQNITINYNTYSMSDAWIDKYSTTTSYAYMFCDYDNLETCIKNDTTYNYSYSNIYVDVEQVKNIDNLYNIIKDENNIISAYELVPVYDIKLICGIEETQNNSYININTLNTSGINFKDNNSASQLYYKLQDNSIIDTTNSVLNNSSYTTTNSANEQLLPVSKITTDGKLLLMDELSVHSINDYGLYDYTIYNKKQFIEIDTLDKYNAINNAIKNYNIDIYSFKPYVKYNGNTIIKNVMMKRQLETEFDGDLIKNENDIDYLWTDVYNLANLFEKNGLEGYDNNKTRYFYFDFINKEHLKKYLEYASANEKNQHLDTNDKPIPLEDWKYRSAVNIDNKGNIIDKNTPFTELYSCERVLVIDPETKLTSIKYRYENFVHLIRRSFKEHNLDPNDDYSNANDYLKTYTLYDLCRNTTFNDNTPFVDINISFNDNKNNKNNKDSIYNWTIPHVHLVYKKKFYPVDEDIMVKLANLFNDDDTSTSNDNEVWCDFYFAKTRSNLEYDILSEDSKYTILRANDINNNDSYTFIDNDMSNLTPVFNDVYYEERENTKISTLININDINACKKVVRTNNDKIKLEKRYRYAKNKYNNFITLNTLCLNKILSIYNKQVKEEVEENNVTTTTTLDSWIEKYLSKVSIFTKYNTTTNFVTLLGPTNNLSEYDYLGLSKYNIFTYYKDGEIYGFYLFAININNTSEMFDVLYGFDMEPIINTNNDNNTNNINYGAKLSSSNVSKFDAFNNHPFFVWKQVKKEDKLVYEYLYNIDNIKYFISNIQTIMPITNISIMKHLYEISNVVSKPSVTNLNINYIAKTLNSSNNSKEYNIVYSKKTNNDIISLKKLKMTRYFGYILPRMKSVDKLIHDSKFNYVFNLKCKWIDNAILEEGIYNSINDTPLDFWIDSVQDNEDDTDRKNSKKYDNFNVKIKDYGTIYNIYKYAPITIFDISNNTTIKNYNNFIENYVEPEYKHFNCSKLYNLIPQIIINDNTKYTYQEILNMSTDTTCINKFINYITNYNNSRYKRSHTSEYDDNLTYSELLFLYNRYKCTIKTNCVGVNNDDLKLFTIRYIYDLL